MELLGVDEIENNFVSKLEQVTMERVNELGSVMFQCGRKHNNDYGKSSSFVFVKKMKCYGEIMEIFEHYGKENKLPWSKYLSFQTVVWIWRPAFRM